MRNGIHGLVGAALISSGMLRLAGVGTEVSTVEEPKREKKHTGEREKARRLKQMEKAKLKRAKQEAKDNG